MGHYLSEMESEAEGNVRMRGAMRTRTLQEHGYWRPGVKGPHLGERGETLLLHHVPCGLAVYDPEAHEPICPAKEK